MAVSFILPMWAFSHPMTLPMLRKGQLSWNFTCQAAGWGKKSWKLFGLLATRISPLSECFAWCAFSASLEYCNGREPCESSPNWWWWWPHVWRLLYLHLFLAILGEIWTWMTGWPLIPTMTGEQIWKSYMVGVRYSKQNSFASFHYVLSFLDRARTGQSCLGDISSVMRTRPVTHTARGLFVTHHRLHELKKQMKKRVSFHFKADMGCPTVHQVHRFPFCWPCVWGACLVFHFLLRHHDGVGNAHGTLVCAGVGTCFGDAWLSKIQPVDLPENLIYNIQSYSHTRIYYFILY